MNLVLFETAAEAAHLASADPRARHIREVLRMKAGDKLFVGVVNGPRGQAVIIEDDERGLRLDIKWEEKIDPPRTIYVLLGMPRPQTARDVLREAATFGVTALHIFNMEKGEPSYANSTLWKTDEWQQRLREGAAQAFATNIPKVVLHASLGLALEKIAATTPQESVRLALDVYEAKVPLSQNAPVSGPVVLALGAERGWSAGERKQLREAGFRLAHLGQRVLRTETAMVAGLSVLLTKRTEF